MVAIGFLELSSIARGVYVADLMVKTADVELIYARPNCPGKYNILISGEVAAVKSSLEAGAEEGGRQIVDQLIIPRIHPDVIRAINLVSKLETTGAVGVMEFFSITGAVLAADTAVKTADVSILNVRLGTGIGGKSFVVITGDVSAVEQAVEAGSLFAKEQGMLIDKVVIPNPVPEMFDSLL